MSYSPSTTLIEVEKMHIMKTFTHFQGVKTSAAAALGISVRTLDAKLEKYAAESKTQEELDAEHRRQREEHLRRSRGNPPAQYDTSATARTQNGPGSVAGVPVESDATAAPEHAVSVPERQEIQEVLPEADAHRRAGRRR